MKAILVMKMPKCCAECPLMLWDAESEYYGACCPTLKEVNCVADSYKENENKGTKPNWCPLKPLPQFMDEAVPYQVSDTEVDCYQDPYATGFNDAIRLITGETE